ncbi:hypothetical protein Mic7113_2571 [Allocoleopsis franciscana PCC 7113]|uniref:Uncharacterized protein n=1 Tax=Allocoleopsis franciscana PCC 7113 TaxID=1173027 RepID=K9WD82_9CYAN|nr:hypothetical protein Mic7113_2571 [Allocoleopsis franciscana PCC 7113]
MGNGVERFSLFVVSASSWEVLHQAFLPLPSPPVIKGRELNSPLNKGGGARCEFNQRLNDISHKANHREKKYQVLSHANLQQLECRC